MGREVDDRGVGVECKMRGDGDVSQGSGVIR